MSKQTCPKCGSKNFTVTSIPAWMKNGPGTWTHCPTCDLPQPPIKKIKPAKENKKVNVR